MRLWIPITFPDKSNNGPPESPPTNVQSVCRKPLSVRITRPKRTTGARLRW